MTFHSRARTGMAAAAFCAIFFFPPSTARSQGGINVSTVASPVNILSISDVDFLNATTPKLLFTITITNTTGHIVPAVMTVRANVYLAGSQTTYDGVIVLTTRAFALGPSLIVTNLDIGGAHLLKDSLYEKNSAAISDIQRTALPGRALPAGTYTFSVTVTEVGGMQSSSDEFAFTLTNPTRVDLLFPVDGDQNANLLPLFQWQFDGYRSRLLVFEQLPNQASLEETASGIPQLSVETSANSYAYPSSGVRSLEPGETYVWFVEGLVATSGGSDLLLRSPLRSFTVASPGMSSLSTILDDLERALDPKYKPVFDDIRAERMSPSGGLRVNGTPVTQADLLRLIQLFRTNPDAVLSLEMEE